MSAHVRGNIYCGTGLVLLLAGLGCLAFVGGQTDLTTAAIRGAVDPTWATKDEFYCHLLWLGLALMLDGVLAFELVFHLETARVE